MRVASLSLGQSLRRPTTTAACPRRGAASSSAHRGRSRNLTHRSLLVLLYVPRTAAVLSQALLSSIFTILQGSPPVHVPRGVEQERTEKHTAGDIYHTHVKFSLSSGRSFDLTEIAGSE